jgi:hypothetical protein
MKRTVIGLGVIAALTAGLLVVAVAGAQEDTPTPSPEADETTRTEYRDAFLDKLADSLGISRDELEAKIDDAASETVDDAVANGDLDEERANDIKERIAETDGFVPFFGPRPHGVDGPGLGIGIHIGRGPGFVFRGDLLKTAADALDLSVQDLIAKLRDGKSIADVAEEKGVSAESIANDVLATAKADLDEKVADGDLTQEEADNIYERLSENLTDVINGEGPFGGAFPGRPFRPFFDGDERPFGGPNDVPEEDIETSLSFGA